MMKKVWKKAMAVTLAGSMVLLAGCGSKTTGQSQGADSGQTTSGESQAGAEGGMATISVMAPQFYGTELKNDHSDEVIKKYEEYTNTKVEWRREANDTYKEKLGLVLMDKDNMPMIVTGSGDLTANVVDAAKRGAFWDLSEFLKDTESYPNLSKADANVLKSVTVDGKVIALYRAREIGRYGFSYRTDWAEKVGITEAPKTPEDVYNMLYKFTYEDPDGNGKDDTYGLEMTKYVGPVDIMQTWFGTGNKWVEEDGKLVPVHQTKEYREALKWIKKIYDDGLIRKDWATVDSGTFGDACKKGEAGAFVDVMDGAKRIWNYYIQNDIKSVVDPTKTATMTLVGPVNDKTLATSGFNGFYLITKAGAKTEDDVKKCLHFLDKMCDDEMMVLADYGLEGITYDKNDAGKVVMRNKLEVQQTPNVGLNSVIAYIPNLTPTNPSLEKQESTIAQEEAIARNKKVAIYNPALGYLANSGVNAEVGTDIEQIIDDARTQYICGQIDDAGFDAAAKQWLDRGGDRLVKEINELYQQDTAK
jgi:putative aldouronate transport system substrate-binding protein